MTSVAPIGAEVRNQPSPFVLTPSCAPSTLTFAPRIGRPCELTTLPRTTMVSVAGAADSAELSSDGCAADGCAGCALAAPAPQTMTRQTKERTRPRTDSNARRPSSQTL